MKQPDIQNLVHFAVKMLQEGREVRTPLGGSSMWPFLRQGDIGLIRPPGKETSFRIGDILVFMGPQRLIAHRLVKRTYMHGKAMYNTRGDACLSCDFPLKSQDILGTLISVDRKGQTVEAPDTHIHVLLSYLLYPLVFIMKYSRALVRRIITLFYSRPCEHVS